MLKSSTAVPFHVSFGADADLRVRADREGLRLSNAVLLGVAMETPAELTAPHEIAPGHWRALLPDGNSGWGWTARPVTPRTLESASHDIYEELLRSLSDDHHLYRVWNFVPRINELDDSGLEHYHLFCRGRARAFEDEFRGGDPESQMPAASAVGTPGEALGVYYCFGRDSVCYLENPDQVPAYRYPRRYGPKAPSFARASVVQHSDTAGGVSFFVSGTASIKGSDTVHPAQPLKQLDVTVDNLNLILAACRDAGAGDAVEAPRQVRVYLRHASDLDALQTRLGEIFLRPQDKATYLQAEVCRPDLDVEIEVSRLR